MHRTLYCIKVAKVTPVRHLNELFFILVDKGLEMAKRNITLRGKAWGN
jgi:hypothetical protein